MICPSHLEELDIFHLRNDEKRSYSDQPKVVAFPKSG